MMEFFKELWKERSVFRPFRFNNEVDQEIKRADFAGVVHINLGSSLADTNSEVRRFYRKTISECRNNLVGTAPNQIPKASWSAWNQKTVAEKVTLEDDDDDDEDPVFVEPPCKKQKMNTNKSSAMTGSADDVEIVKVVSGKASLKHIWSSFPSKQSLLRLGFSTPKGRRSTILQEEQKEDKRKYSELLRCQVYPRVCSRPFSSPRVNYFTPSKFDQFKEVMKCQTESAKKAPKVDHVDLEGSNEPTPATTKVQVNRRHSITPVTEATPKPQHIEEVPRSKTPLRSLKFPPDVEFVDPGFVEEIKQKHREQLKSFKEEKEALLKSSDLYSKRNKAAEKQRTERVLEDIEKQFKNYIEISQSVIEESEDEVEVIPPLPELTKNMQREIDAALGRRNPNDVLVDAFNVKIHQRDIHTLGGLNWLNDEVINFYMNLLMERGKKEKYPSVYAFNTFFYPKLVSGGHSVLKRWTKKVDIFSYDFLVAPVHLGVHWCMVVMDLAKKTVMYFDSMGGRNDQCLTALKQYLCDEKMDKKKEKLDTSDWRFICMKDIPQQMNGSDCGMFSCMYAEYTCRRAPITFTQEDMPYFRRKMIYEILKVKLLC